jgi:hypothetical protein
MEVLGSIEHSLTALALDVAEIRRQAGGYNPRAGRRA